MRGSVSADDPCTRFRRRGRISGRCQGLSNKKMSLCSMVSRNRAMKKNRKKRKTSADLVVLAEPSVCYSVSEPLSCVSRVRPG